VQNVEAGAAKRTRWGGLAVGVLVLVAVTAIVAYAIGSGSSSTKTVVHTVVKDVAVAPTATTAPRCLPGAAPGSCNIDEAAQAKIPDVPLDPGAHAQLAMELVAARAAALKYPTVADATRAGFIPAGKFSPETGAHYINIGATLHAGFDAANPGSLIYDGDSPTSRVIGAMYMSSDAAPPVGFVGPNDHWHRHTNTCVEFSGGKIIVPFAADSDVTQQQCTDVHGVFMKRTVWMVHAWVVPGWESPLGVFSHNNPDVKCADGTVKTDSRGFCTGT
jgi:hypothetical protein